jgi:hypothetical protein
MRNDSMRPSSAAVNTPAAGPMSRAAAVLKVSEMEKLISIAGTRSASHPAVAVSTSMAISAYETGSVATSQTENAPTPRRRR